MRRVLSVWSAGIVALLVVAASFACLIAAGVSGRAAEPGRVERQSTPSTAFADLFHDYRRGDADRVIRILATWTDRQIERDAKLPRGEDDPWSKAALALLLSEAPLEPQGTLAGPSRSHVVAGDRAFALIDEAYDSAYATGDKRLLAFCRDWYLVGLTANMRTGIDFEAELRRRFGDDPLAQLELGKRAEYSMVIFNTGDADGYVKNGEVVGTSSHGMYSAEAAKAEHDYRRAVSLDPSLVEARVRLGHVLWFLDRRDESERELTQAAREASSANAATLAYLANLFLGQLLEEDARPDAARQAYQEAIRVYSAGQIARLSLGRLLVAAGREADGWDMTATVLDPEAWGGRAPDPWRSYTLEAKTWWPSVRFSVLRSQVRQQ
jgi:tetratricopeptide (TPR) repeat protein